MQVKHVRRLTIYNSNKFKSNSLICITLFQEFILLFLTNQNGISFDSQCKLIGYQSPRSKMKTMRALHFSGRYGASYSHSPEHEECYQPAELPLSQLSMRVDFTWANFVATLPQMLHASSYSCCKQARKAMLPSYALGPRDDDGWR